MHQALERDGIAGHRSVASYALHRDRPNERIIGRVVGKGLGGDELGERLGLTIDGVDGRVHHIEVPAASAEDIRRGSIVAVEPPPTQPRIADDNILQHTDAQGVYRPSTHLESVQETMPRIDHERHVQSHVRRLEALRRAYIVERIHDDHWQVPADLPERGLAHDIARDGKGARITILSPIGLKQQIGHDGATWLDRELVAREPLALAESGFGREVNTALDRRAQRLIEMGHATAKDGMITIPHRTVAVLERQEVERVGRQMAAERGLTYEPGKPGNYVSGTLVGSTQLVSGRFAMIDDGLGFSLVPWSDPLEKRLGQHLSGVGTSGGGVDWSFGRKRGLGL